MHIIQFIINFRKKLTLWEEKMIRMGNLDLVRNTSLKKNTKAPAQEFWCPGSVENEGADLQFGELEEQTRAKIPDVKIEKNIDKKNIQFDSFTRNNELSVQKSQDTSEFAPKTLNNHKSQTMNYDNTNDEPVDKNDTVDNKMKNKNEVPLNIPKDKTNSSKGVLNIFKKMFKF